MSLILDILEEMWNTTLNYRGVSVNLFGIPHFKSKNQTSLRTTLYRLEKIRLINKNNGGWKITNAGKKYLNDHKEDLAQFLSPFKKSTPKDLILMFDIPQQSRNHRDWLRRQLKEFEYVMIQQSVWVGPSPLPKEFKDYLKRWISKNLLKLLNFQNPTFRNDSVILFTPVNRITEFNWL